MAELLFIERIHMDGSLQHSRRAGSQNTKVSLQSYDDPRVILIHSRVMEKENKKARDDARKEYNETVRVCASLRDFAHVNEL